MIICVSLSPSIDRSGYVETFRPGRLNRLTQVRVEAGGKAVNAAKALRALGSIPILVGFSDDRHTSLVSALSLKTNFVKVTGVRVNHKITDGAGQLTEVNESFPPEPVDAARMLSSLSIVMERVRAYADDDVSFMLMGSLPHGAPDDIYAELIEMMREKRRRVLLDCDGMPFRLALRASPDVIKPNLTEFEQFFGRKMQRGDYVKHCREIIHAHGVKLVALSLGEEGAVFVTEDKSVRVCGEKITDRSPVGAGDAMCAAIMHSLETGETDLERIAKFSAATAQAYVMRDGGGEISKALAEKLVGEITVVSKV